MSDLIDIRTYDTEKSSVEAIAAELRPPLFLKFAEETEAVSRIVRDVAARGDEALVEYVRKFDWPSATPEGFEVPQSEIEAAHDSLPDDQRRALKKACDQVRSFHERALPESWVNRQADRALGQRWMPLERVGVCVPGTPPLPSTLYMCAVPARVAGVDEIVVVCPAKEDGKVQELVLAAAKEAQVDRVFRIGGPQAVAAMAFGTDTIPRVDKIVGPGSIYTTLAKREVFGQVGIESLPGPSDVLIISDGNAPPAWVAADLLSQAEHGELSSAILCTPSEDHAQAVHRELTRQTAELERGEHALDSLRERGALVLCRSLEDCVAVANAVAPEHLEVLCEDAEEVSQGLRTAGAIFLGEHTPEPVGDYVAGPSHVLPTEGTARYASPLGVEDFMRRSSVLEYSLGALKTDAQDIITLAEAEGLTAHARSVRIRFEE
ncbi:MAG: histidinol dehydrogenase [Armatimonadia bacterium]|nr:histidinol dehydrogenase [Armatimonadia bacterium]